MTLETVPFLKEVSKQELKMVLEDLIDRSKGKNPLTWQGPLTSCSQPPTPWSHPVASYSSNYALPLDIGFKSPVDVFLHSPVKSHESRQGWGQERGRQVLNNPNLTSWRSGPVNPFKGRPPCLRVGRGSQGHEYDYCNGAKCVTRQNSVKPSKRECHS